MAAEVTELLVGCGHRRIKMLWVGDDNEWHNLTTLDVNPDCKPDVVWDLEKTPYPFESASFDQIHCYDVIEHLGQQGDVESFFRHFREFHRLLKPHGLFFAATPEWNDQWAWGDPGHRRIINEGSLIFLSQEAYKRKLGATATSDYRRYLGDADFAVVGLWHKEGTFLFALQALKHGAT